MKFIKLTQSVTKTKFVDTGKGYTAAERLETKGPVWVNVERICYIEPKQSNDGSSRTEITFLDTYEASCHVKVFETPEEILARFT